jgi:hypothetical protein
VSLRPSHTPHGGHAMRCVWHAMQVHESEQEVPQVFHALLDVVQERVCAFKRRHIQMHKT